MKLVRTDDSRRLRIEGGEMEMEIRIRYAETGNAFRGAYLDNVIIPRLISAFNVDASTPKTMAQVLKSNP